MIRYQGCEIARRWSAWMDKKARGGDDGAGIWVDLKWEEVDSRESGERGGGGVRTKGRSRQKLPSKPTRPAQAGRVSARPRLARLAARLRSLWRRRRPSISTCNQPTLPFCLPIAEDAAGLLDLLALTSLERVAMSPPPSPPAKPVAIRDRVKAFERLGSTASKSNSSPPQSSAFSGGAYIARTSSVPRSRESSIPLYSPSAARPDVDPLAEFGALPTAPKPTAAPAAYSSLPLPSSSSGRNLASTSTNNAPSSSPTSSFEAFASAASLRKMRSGTSLRDFTESSLPRTRNGRSTQSSNQSSVSGKVPLPPPASGQSDLDDVSSGRASPTTSFRASPALPPRPAPGQHFGSRATPVITHNAFDPLPPPTHRSSLSSSSSSSRNPLDDEEDNYGLSLHPTLHPVASPVSSRAPSRGSNRSAPASPAPRNRYAGESGGSSSAAADIRLHPPTPSPERRPVEGAEAAASGAPDLPPRRASGDQDSNSSPTSPFASRSNSSGKQPPALPPRIAAPAPPVSYKPRVSSGGSSSSSSAATVASKVPPPPPPSGPTSSQMFQTHSGSGSAATPRRGRHSPSASTGSSPAGSPAPGAAFGHRSTRSIGPSGVNTDSSPASSSSPLPHQTSRGLTTASAAAAAVPHFLPPPSRNRASSVGPTRPRSRTESASSSGSGNGGSPLPQPRLRGVGAPTAASSTNPRGLGIGLPPVRTSAANSAATPRLSRPTRSMAPKSEAARQMYEGLWDREMVALARRREQRRKAGQHHSSAPTSKTTRMPPSLVRKIWSRSRLPSTTLALIWAAAIAYDQDSEAVVSPSAHEESHELGGKAQRQPPRGLSKEAFVRGVSAIDGELAWRAARRRARSAKKVGVSGGRDTSPLATPRASASGGYRSASSPTRSFKAGGGTSAATGVDSGHVASAVRRKLPPPPPPA